MYAIQGVPIPLSPPPQTNSGVGQTIQIHCGKLEPFSAIDFKGFCFLSIFTIYTVYFKKDPFSIKEKKCGNMAKQHDFAYHVMDSNW